MDDFKLHQWLNKRRERMQGMHPEVLFEGIRRGDVAVLSRAITLVESAREEDRVAANALLQLCLPFAGNSLRVGITGVPGVGKSTFIEAFGQALVHAGKKVAVLAVDPSSGISGGSILGDKTRMTVLSATANAYIRPSAAGETLGGVARKTRESIILCEAAGFDFIIVETVGVGQSETVVKSMVDFFLLLMLSGAGDELQGIKKGIMEMADALVITKADGDNVKKAATAAREYKNALHLFPPNENEWIPRVSTCSALTGEGLKAVMETINAFENHNRTNGWLQANRNLQDRKWLKDALKEMILTDFFSQPNTKNLMEECLNGVASGAMTSFAAAEKMFVFYKENGRGI